MTETLWPQNQNRLDAKQTNDLLQKLQPSLEQWRLQHGLSEDVLLQLEAVDLPLAARLAGEIDTHGFRVLGLSGAQGAGKSTRAALLSEILTHGFGKRVVTFSLDDIYLSRAERQQLAHDIHPLLATRGVPGTHDPLLGHYLLQQLRAADANDIIPLPTFDKAIDDRLPPELWRCASGPVDLVIFEGWCVGAMPQSDEELTEPINELERSDDPDGLWRRFVNDELSRAYIDLFTDIDILLLLQVPGMDQVFDWRLRQEEQLRSRHSNQTDGLKIMSESDLHRFIQHYERITRVILAEMPERADIVLALNERQQVAAIRVNE